MPADDFISDYLSAWAPGDLAAGNAGHLEGLSPSLISRGLARIRTDKKLHFNFCFCLYP
jgi:hypothetical protein